MNALLYLWRTTLKNRILALKKNPAMLFLYVFIIAMIGVTVFSSTQMDANEIGIIPGDVILRFGAVCFVLPLLFFILTSWSGFSSGGNFFNVSDVHLLFPSPISPKLIMIFGLFKSMGLVLLACIFVLFQSATLRMLTGAEPFGIVALYVGMVPAMFAGQLAALAIYQFINGNIMRKNIIRGIYIALITALIVTPIAMDRNNILNSVLTMLNSDVISYIPIVGWAKALSLAVYQGNVTSIIIYAALMIAVCALFLVFFIKGKCDYYEDVIGAAEKTAAVKAMQAEDGNNFKAISMNRKIKVRDTGLGFGKAASALFSKQWREIRRNRLYFVDTTTLFVLAFSLFMAFITGSDQSAPSIVPLVSSFAMSVYMYMFFSMTGIWADELKKPFIYLLPDTAPKKLIWASLPSLIKSLTDGIVIFVITGIIFKAQIWEIAVMSIAFASCGWIFVAGDILSQRIFKRQIGKGILRLFYFLILLVLIAPGAILAIISASVLSVFGLTLLGLLSLVIWNVIVYAIVVLLCRNVLETMDLA